jgi:hypothetical protein
MKTNTRQPPLASGSTLRRLLLYPPELRARTFRSKNLADLCPEAMRVTLAG